MEKHSSASLISNSEGAVSFYELSTTEFLGVRNTSFIAVSVKTSVTRTFLRLSLLLHLAELFLF